MGSTTELRINLAALKQQDPYIGNITDSSAHVAVYSFSPESNEWEKTDVEGTLFVYRRVAPPYWGFTILNRLSMENLTEPLTSELEFQTQNAFLLYRNAKLLIYGIWFYDQEDCKRIGELLEKLCRESQTVPSNANVQRINLFAAGDNNIMQAKEAARKSSSPTSNSANSVSPGSSVGGIRRPPSNEEADSESDDKEVVQSNKPSFDILDLLSKAQDKYEKEKRNTPDPVVENIQNGSILSPADTEPTLVKPVPVKPVHRQKLDVATLFKQQPPKPPDVNSTAVSNGQAKTVPLATTPAVNTPYAGMISHPAPNLPAPAAAITIPQQTRRVARPIGRSFSMTEMAMRQHLDAYMNGNVMSVEEVEAGLNRNAAVANRQQQVNSTLDRMIDRINSGGVMPSTPAGLSQTPALAGIQEVGINFSTNKASAGNSGSIVVNGNKALHDESEVFTTESTMPYAGTSVRPPMQTFVKPFTGIRQRSISSSGVQAMNHTAASNSVPIPTNAQFTPNFPIVPNLPNASSKPPTTSVFPSMPQSNPLQNAEPQLLLHGNAINPSKPILTVTDPTPQVSSIATTVSSITIAQKPAKVSLNPAIMPHSSKSSPALPTTLISPEDFERSATTPQKKLELKHRLLQEVQQPQQKIQTPLSKDELQQTLVALLQKDNSFLTAIHEAYLTNFKQK